MIWRRFWLLALWALASRAAASPARYALVVGDNEGDASDGPLRFAERDAARLGDILRDLGGVSPENLTVLTDVDGESLRRTLIALNARLRSEVSPGLLFVFYSGHGDAEALHLRGTRLPLAELRVLVAGSPASARVLVIDSCRSGGLTRVKGGTPGPSFAVVLEAPPSSAEGLALVTSSAAGEDAQESSRLEASVFTSNT